LLYSIALNLKEDIYSPEEIVFKIDDRSNKGLYFIEEGNVEIYFDKQFNAIEILGKNDVFGEIGFFSDFRQASVRAADFLTLLHIDKQEFLRVLSKYPTDHVIDKF
jgi:CRP-like cAMP-binding protein